MSYKVIIVDDEKFARSALKGILENYFPNHFQIMEECSNVPDAVKMIHFHKPNLVFLDIEMPQYSGFELLSFFDSENIFFKIVFVTAYDEYALKAFEISAIDYLLKPIRPEQIERVLKKLENQQTNDDYKNLIENLKNLENPKITLQDNNCFYFIKLSDIIFFEAEGSYTKVYVENHPTIIVTKKIGDFEYLEKDFSFFRVHRSFIVNLHKITKILKKDHDLEMTNGKLIPISIEKRKTLLERLG